MPGNVRTKNIDYDDDDYYDEEDDYYDDYGYEDGGDAGEQLYGGDDYYDEPVAKPPATPLAAQSKANTFAITKINQKGKHFTPTNQPCTCTWPRSSTPLRDCREYSTRHFEVLPLIGLAQDSTTSAMSQYMKPSSYFEGIQWGLSPNSRSGSIIEVPHRRRGGLLGGSGKISKLQALAAQRRKEQEEKKNREATLGPESAPSSKSSSVAILDKLSKPTAFLDQQSTTSTNGTLLSKDPPSRYKRQKLEQPAPEAEPSAAQVLPKQQSTWSEEKPREETFEVRARPSVFASALVRDLQPAHSSAETSTQYEVVVTDTNADSNPFAGPSPDDVVQKAQSKSKQPPAKKNENAKAAPKNGVVQGVAAMKIDDAPKVKSKNLDVPAEFEKTNQRSSANFVVIGHVDHGKSTLMGRLLYDLKHPSMTQRDYNKLQKASSEAGKSSFALAWAMDSTEEERSRGVTIDIATNHFSTDSTDFTILDAPGHRDFVPNMIGGTSQADFAVLVIDASANAFEAGLKGQTREHALLARSMGIARIVVAVNKMDAAKWNKERYNEITDQLKGFFTGAGFNPKTIMFIPCAGLTGENVVTPLTAEQKKQASWYEGPTLVSALEASEPAKRRIRDPLRLTISDVFKPTAPGVPTGDISITGKIDAGTLQIGTVVLAQPATEAATIKGIELNGEPRDWAVAGQIVTLHLVGIEPEHLRSGDVICEKGKGQLQNVTTFTAKCLAFEHLLPGAVDCFRGRMQSAGRITEFIEIVGKEENANGKNGAEKSAKKKKPRVVKPQQVVRLRVALDNGEKGLPLETPDRIVLRAEGRTVAAGILDGVGGFIS